MFIFSTSMLVRVYCDIGHPQAVACRKPWCQYLYRNGSLEDALKTLEGYDAR